MTSPNPSPNRVIIVRQARSSRRKRRPSGWQIPPGLIAAVLFAAGAGGVWWMAQDPQADSDPVLAEVEPAEAVTEEPAPERLVSPTDVAAPAESAPALPEPVAKVAAEPAPAPDLFPRLLVMDALGAAKKENTQWHTDAWTLAKTHGQYNNYRDLLARSLQAFAGSGKKSIREITQGEYSGPALIRHAFLSAVPEKLLASMAARIETGDFIFWLMDTPAAMQSFIRQLSPDDNLSDALRVWAALYAENPAAQTKYLELAIAISLVFDRPVHPAAERYAQPIDALERFAHFYQNNEAGRLAGKVHKMTAAELVWVVGVPVPQDELDWAVKKAGFRQKTWGAAYGTIKYDMDRAVTGKDSYTAYTFAEIQKKGGICSDQSYFCAWTACAHGIPAAIITGDGPRGPHAWVAWQAGDCDWKLSGRSAGYPAGTALNPQTGDSISEEVLLRMGERKAADPGSVLQASQSLWMAAVLSEKPEQALHHITEATKTAPLMTAPATALLSHWVQHQSAASLDEWTRLLRKLRKDFREVPPLMTATDDAEEQFVFARKETAGILRDLRREAKKTGETSSADAGVAADSGRLAQSLHRQAKILKERGELTAISLLYRRALTENGDDAATFKVLAGDFFSYFQDDPAMATKVARELEQTCRRSIGRGKGDWFDVQSQNSAWQVVAEIYRAAGDSPKADLIIRDCKAREKAAKYRAL